jgi:ATP adenylyltransferase
VDYERIWAPWRLSYILGDAPSPEQAPQANLLPGGAADCFLCQAAAAGDECRKLVVARTDRCVALLNRYPYNNGHMLVAPRRHIAGLDQLESCEPSDMLETIARMTRLLSKVLKPEGFNIGLNLGRAAGAGLPGHLHWHIVPRWSGDTNFMPVLSGIRVIPQSLEALWQGLSQASGEGMRG